MFDMFYLSKSGAEIDPAVWLAVKLTKKTIYCR